jgi:hypothetical protein
MRASASGGGWHPHGGYARRAIRPAAAGRGHAPAGSQAGASKLAPTAEARPPHGGGGGGRRHYHSTITTHARTHTKLATRVAAAAAAIGPGKGELTGTLLCQVGTGRSV